MPRAIAGSAAALACLGMLGGCYLQIDDSPSAASIVSRERTPQERATRALFGWYQVHWNPPRSTVELAQSSALVVSGTLTELRDGRVEGFDTNSQGSPRTLVLAIRPSRIVEGTLPRRSDGIVYVEIPPPQPVYGVGFSQAIPVGAAVVLYLIPANNGSGLERISDWNAGRPPGQPLYQAVNPAGFLVQIAGQQRWAWLFDPHLAVAASENQVLPGGSVVLRPYRVNAGAGVETGGR